jgi:hypothetical protein
MVFAGLAASAAFDLFSQLQPDKPKSGGTGVTPASSFSLPQDPAATQAAQTAAEMAIGRSGESEPDAEGAAAKKNGMDTLLSAQGQAQAHHKSHSMSVLRELMKSSQDGTVKKSDFEAALGKDDDTRASDLFDRIDQNHDNAVTNAELTSFLDTYRRNAAAGTAGKGRSLAVAA